LVAIGGILGANARFAVSTRSVRRWGVGFPYGTLFVNVTGSAAIGFVLTCLPEHFGGGRDESLFIATGFLGSYTTFSTFAYESVGLIKRAGRGPLLANLVASLIGGLTGAAAGILLATLINRQL
jgi:CrcB protein